MLSLVWNCQSLFFPLIFASFPLRLNLYLNIVSAVLGVGQMTLSSYTKSDTVLMKLSLTLIYYKKKKKNSGACHSFVLCLGYIPISPFIFFQE